jgi:hypothetical protein
MTSSNMTCDAFDTAFPDFLEGTLDERGRAAVEGHLSECVRCASLLRDIDNIRKEAAALPDLAPTRDLWAGIEARIAAPVIPLAAPARHQRRRSPAWMGIAAAALVVSTAGVTYMLTARSLRVSEPAAIAQLPAVTATEPAGATGSTTMSEAGGTAPAVAEAAAAKPRGGSLAGAPAPTPRLASSDVSGRQAVQAQLVSADQAHADAVYGREIEMLQKIVGQRKTMLDSSTVAIIERNLKIIDAAIEQSRAALAADPASRLLSQQLTHALDKKVELLRTAAMMPASI